MIGRLRLWSGYVLFAYATTHLLNHGLGIISLEAMAAGLEVFVAIWRQPIGTALLLSAISVHLALVLWSLFQRRRLAMSLAEWSQLLLGLSIIPLGAIHFVGSRGAYELFDTQVSYPYIMLALLAGGLEAIARQFALVLAVWIHGCIGLHRAWRLKAWYGPARNWLLGLAVAWPTLALSGSISALGQVAELRASPARLQAAVEAIRPPGPQQVKLLYAIADGLKFGLGGLLILVLVARPLRSFWQRRHGVVRLDYGGLPDGPRNVSVPVGLSVLEISRSFGIPHASVCGGRGRCSTCRVRIADHERIELPQASAEERRVLTRIDAPEDVRLACQLRPAAGTYRVTPLLPPAVSPAEAYRPQSGAHGRERTIVVLFCDLRGFTTLSEGRLPYDVVFILNRYFRAVGEAVTAAGGHVDKFIGDGAMALFGAEGAPGAATDPGRAARQALDAARRIAIAVDGLNSSLSGDLDLPLRLGIGLHAGPAIVGEMGYGRSVSLTAIGDTVNTASRLESASKELKCQLVISEDLLQLAGIALDNHPAHLLEVRGRQNRLRVRSVADASELEITAM